MPKIFAGRRRQLLLRLSLNGILQALAIVGSMLLVRHAFDVLLNPAFDDPEVNLYDLSEVWEVLLFAAGLLGCTGAAAWLRLVERVDAERLGQDYVHRVRLRIFDRMGSFAPRALSRRTTGAASLRFVGDLSALRRWVSLGLARIVVASIICLLSLSFLASLDPFLAFGSFLVLALGLGWNLSLGPRMHQAAVAARRRRGRLAGNITEKIRVFTAIQAFNQQDRERKRFSRQSRQLRAAMVERARTSSHMRVVTDGATAASMGLVLSLGALQVFRTQTSAGNVVAAMAVVGFLSTAFRDLGRVHEYLQDFRVSRRKIMEFMQTERLKGRASALPPLQVSTGALSFRNVSLGTALQGISAEAPGRARIALTGPNGSGKSTLCAVAARLADPDAGQVLLDGQNLRRCRLDSVRQAIGIVSPDLPLLRGPLKENLRYRSPEASAEELEQLRRFCGLDELLAELPGGEDFLVQEGGENLSLGQRHRVAIARALLGTPPLLILDEIDANLDPKAATVIDRLLDSYPGTILLVTRADERLKKVDLIWEFEQGRLLRVIDNHLDWGRDKG